MNILCIPTLFNLVISLQWCRVFTTNKENRNLHKGRDRNTTSLWTLTYLSGSSGQKLIQQARRALLISNLELLKSEAIVNVVSTAVSRHKQLLPCKPKPHKLSIALCPMPFSFFPLFTVVVFGSLLHAMSTNCHLDSIINLLMQSEEQKNRPRFVNNTNHEWSKSSVIEPSSKSPGTKHVGFKGQKQTRPIK